MMAFLLKIIDPFGFGTLRKVLSGSAQTPPHPIPAVAVVASQVLPTAAAEGLKIVSVPIKLQEIKTPSLLKIAVMVGLQFAKHKTKQLFVAFACKCYASYWSGAKEAVNRSQVADEADAVLDKLEEFPPVLNTLMTNFGTEMQKRENRLEAAKHSLVEKEQQAQKLRALLDTIKVEDVEAALENLSQRLEAVSKKHEGNHSVLVVAMKDLMEVEKDLIDTLAILENVKQKLEEKTAEIAELRKLISAAGTNESLELHRWGVQ
ncbi:MAG: hypothetical protein ABSA17_05640 [Rhabdochlamydiaceae bacterium]|jgi:hypothetical protein